MKPPHTRREGLSVLFLMRFLALDLGLIADLWMERLRTQSADLETSALSQRWHFFWP